MSKQVKLHNEVILVGRIINRQKNIRCNNLKAIRIKLALPNDLDYNLEPNIAYVYIYGKKDYIPVYLAYNKELVEEILK